MNRRSLPETAGLATEALAVYLQHALIEPFRGAPSLPRAMHYLSTHRCNARCIMCGIWKEGDTSNEDLSPEELAVALSDPLFSRMEYVGMSGGEPLLRHDLVELASAFLEGCRHLKRFSLTTNGLIPQRAESLLPAVADRAGNAGVLFDVCVSVHGTGETLSEIYGVPRAFEKMRRTVEILEALRGEERLSFSFNCVLLAENLDNVRELTRWAGERDIPVSFVVGEQRERFRTGGLENAFVGTGRRKDLISFLRSVADDPAQGAPSAVKYRELADVLEGRRTRRLSCYYAMGGLLLGHDGTLYYCPHSKAIGTVRQRPPREIFYDPVNLDYRRTALLKNRCLTCPPYTRTRWEIEKDLPRMVLASARRRVENLFRYRET